MREKNDSLAYIYRDCHFIAERKGDTAGIQDALALIYLAISPPLLPHSVTFYLFRIGLYTKDKALDLYARVWL